MGEAPCGGGKRPRSSALPGEKAAIHSIVDDADLARGGAKKTRQIVRRLPADRNHVRGTGRARRRQRRQVEPLGRRELVGQVQKAQVMHRDHPRHTRRQRQHIDQPMHQVCIQSSATATAAPSAPRRCAAAGRSSGSRLATQRTPAAWNSGVCVSAVKRWDVTPSARQLTQRRQQAAAVGAHPRAAIARLPAQQLGVDDHMLRRFWIFDFRFWIDGCRHGASLSYGNGVSGQKLIACEVEVIMDEQQFKLRTKQLALRVIRLADSLPRTSTGEVLGRQILRSATSVGANYRSCMSRPFLSGYGRQASDSPRRSRRNIVLAGTHQRQRPRA